MEPRVFVMSDIHGEKDRFFEMLRKISFRPEDRLFIIGDVIDRAPGGVDLLEYIMQAPNIHMILGNHEQMLLDDLGPEKQYGAKALWLSNGGGCTRRELLYLSTGERRRAILRFVAGLPDSVEIVVGGEHFLLVHGFPAETKEDRIWGRIEPQDQNPIPGKTVIVGHTPTCFLTGDFETLFRIWKKPGLIDIDCGCGNKTNMRALACLQLNTMEEYYV